MNPRLVRSIDVAPQRWRNGGGLTRELHAGPPGADWQWRVSVADIEVDGPFSAYPGVQRWFTVLQGAGVELRIDGAARRLRRGDEPLAFDGAAAVDCHLVDGPTRDLNLMLRQAHGRLEIATDGHPWSPQAEQCGLFSAVAGSCEAGDRRHALPAYALLWFERAPERLVYTAGQRPAGLIGWWLAAAPQRDSA